MLKARRSSIFEASQPYQMFCVNVPIYECSEKRCGGSANFIFKNVQNILENFDCH